MKLTNAHLVVVRDERGRYTVALWADDTRSNRNEFKSRNLLFELPAGAAPLYEDLSAILRMVSEELQR